MLVLILSLLLLHSGTVYVKKYPYTTYVLEHPSEYEGKVVALRGEISEINVEGKTYILTLSHYGREFKAYAPIGMLQNLNFEVGDILDLKAVSHLKNNYVVVEDILLWNSWQYKWLFYRSIIGGMVVIGVLLADWKKIRKVMVFA